MNDVHMQIHLEHARNLVGSVTWAAKSWSKRATEWLQTEPHDLELGEHGEVTFHVNGYENGFKIEARTLSQMVDARGVKKPTVLARRRNFLHEAGR